MADPFAIVPEADRLLPRVLPDFLHPEFFFVNIGANDGVTNDPIYPFLRRHRWRGIAVEPVDYICRELRRNYAEFEGVIVEHAAIAATPRPLYYVPPGVVDQGFVRQISSLHAPYVTKSIWEMRMCRFEGEVPTGVEDHIVQADVPCLTFDELMRKHDVRQVDFLNIDAEHSDFEILSLVDFDRWRPAVICVETSEFTEGQRAAAAERLLLAGYRFLEAFDLFSVIYVRADAARPAVASA